MLLPRALNLARSHLRVRWLSPQELTRLVPLLLPIIRMGVGLATRSGAARFIHDAYASLPATAHLGSTATTLLDALLNASGRERSAPVRRALAAAYAAVLLHATPKQVTGQTEKIRAALAPGSPNTAAPRLGAAAVARELCARQESSLADAV